MSQTQVRISNEGSHATITFFTEDGLNVLSPEVLHSFGAAVARVKQDARIRTTTIQAEGKVFLAGADAKKMPDFGTAEARDYGALGQGVFNDLASLPSITVAGATWPTARHPTLTGTRLRRPRRWQSPRNDGVD